MHCLRDTQSSSLIDEYFEREREKVSYCLDDLWNKNYIYWDALRFLWTLVDLEVGL